MLVHTAQSDNGEKKKVACQQSKLTLTVSLAIHEVLLNHIQSVDRECSLILNPSTYDLIIALCHEVPTHHFFCGAGSSLNGEYACINCCNASIAPLMFLIIPPSYRQIFLFFFLFFCENITILTSHDCQY